jgi:hypothetical protein
VKVAGEIVSARPHRTELPGKKSFDCLCDGVAM